MTDADSLKRASSLPSSQAIIQPPILPIHRPHAISSGSDGFWTWGNVQLCATQGNIPRTFAVVRLLPQSSTPSTTDRSSHPPYSPLLSSPIQPIFTAVVLSYNRMTSAINALAQPIGFTQAREVVHHIRVRPDRTTSATHADQVTNPSTVRCR